MEWCIVTLFCILYWDYEVLVNKNNQQYNFFAPGKTRYAASDSVWSSMMLA